MRFVYHHRTAGRGAEGLHIMSLVNSLEAAGHSVEIVSPPGVDPRRTAGATPLDKGAAVQSGLSRVWQWMSCRAPQVLFEAAELGYNLFAALSLLVVFGRRRPSVYYERYAFFVFAGVFMARAFRIPVILEVNEVAAIPRARKQVLIKLCCWLERRIFAAADRIVTVSSFLTAEVERRGARPAAVQTMPNAIDPGRFNQSGAGRVVREAHGLAGCTVAGFVGWFDHWDRLDLLVDALAVLHESEPDLRVLLVGDGPVAGELRQRIEAYGLEQRVIFAGAVPRSEVPAWIDSMDVCVLPDSNPFGSPMVLFEFMAMGKAVIAPDLPPVRDVLRHGETGLLIEGGNSAQLSEAIRLLTVDRELRQHLGMRAREEILTNRTWEANAKRVIGYATDLFRRDAEVLA